MKNIIIKENELFVIIDTNGNIARAAGKGKTPIFKSINMARQHAWRYTSPSAKENEDYFIARYVVDVDARAEME